MFKCQLMLLYSGLEKDRKWDEIGK